MVVCTSRLATVSLQCCSAEICSCHVLKTLPPSADQEWKNKKRKGGDPGAKGAHFTLTLKPCNTFFKHRWNFVSCL